ncbi:alpha/beta hydrolase [Streptomyces mexicanus]|jgi:pimeloyl-ACP methyl ester carboxylesterase|uniref:alpha/beta hydrolase n=1 Tax=Streptomyces mexicanus TaxID=178566 RepID=UPI003675CEE0
MASNNTNTDLPRLLLVHGAWHRSGCWDQLRSVLDTAGWSTHVVDLPSAGDETAGIHEDAQAVQRALEAIEGPVVVIAHSYGGVPVSQAVTEATGVTHVVYLAAYQLDIGESVLAYHGRSVPDEPRGFQPLFGEPTATLYGDLPRVAAEVAAEKLVPQSVKSFCEPLTRAGWHTIPSTYVICEEDRALLPQFQEDMSRRAGAVLRLPSQHSPFLSMPEECADLLIRIARRATT